MRGSASPAVSQFSAIMLGVIAGCGGFVLAWQAAAIADDQRDAATAELRASAHWLAALAARTPAGDDLSAALADASRQLDVALCVFNADGVVTAQSPGPGLPAPATASERRRSPGSSSVYRRFSPQLGGEGLFVAQSVTDPDGTENRTVRAGRAIASIEAAARRRQAALAWRVLACTAGAMAIVAVVIRRRQRRLRLIGHVADRLAAGDHEARVPADATRELGGLGSTLNGIADQLSSRGETLHRERREALAILGSMVEGVVAVDREMRVVQINNEARRALGIEAGQVTGRTLWDITRVQPVWQLLERVIRGTREARDEITLSGRDGARSLSLHATPLRSEAVGHIAGAVVVLHDITGQRRLEQVRRDFVTNVSHELKTPLTSIRGFVETLLDDRDAPPEVRERFLLKIKDHSHRLSALVADLLTLSRIESQGLGPRRGPLDLRTPVRASVELLATRADDNDLTLATDLPPDPVPVFGDAEMLRQLVDNLLGNALKYTPAGGSVHVTLTVDGGEALLRVDDTGVGLAPEQQERIFERFYRVDRARSRELGGTGLGLSIVKHAVLAHSGRVSVDSTLGVGSSFRVWLPLSPERP